MNLPNHRHCAAFTLIEMTVVILIIATLAAALLTATSGMFDRARKVQAKNDLTQLVTAINAFLYRVPGQYPVAAQSGDDSADYLGADDANGTAVINTLRVPTPGLPPALNPRGIVFLNVLTAKSSTAPISGVGTGRSRLVRSLGKCLPLQDRQQLQFNVDQSLHCECRNNFANHRLHRLVAWKDKAGGSGDKNATTAVDDVLSWQ